MLPQIFRSDRSTYVRNIFFHSFYAFEDTCFIHFVAREKASLISVFLNKCFYPFLNITSEYCNLLFCRALLTINSEVDIKLKPSTQLNELWKLFH